MSGQAAFRLPGSERVLGPSGGCDMWAEIEVTSDITGETHILRYDERTGKWTGGTLYLRQQAQSASAGIPAADSRRARTAAEDAVREMGGRIVALGTWPWPEGWGPDEPDKLEAEKRGIIVG